MNFIPENTPITSKIGSVSCLTNYTTKPISYTLSQQSNYFGINKDTGEIYLQQSLMNMVSVSQSISISCSNGMTSDTCSIQFSVMPSISSQPVWVFPNVNNFEQCLVIREVFIYFYLKYYPLDINFHPKEFRYKLFGNISSCWAIRARRKSKFYSIFICWSRLLNWSRTWISNKKQRYRSDISG